MVGALIRALAQRVCRRGGVFQRAPGPGLRPPLGGAIAGQVQGLCVTSAAGVLVCQRSGGLGPGIGHHHLKESGAGSVGQWVQPPPGAEVLKQQRNHHFKISILSNSSKEVNENSIPHPQMRGH